MTSYISRSTHDLARHNKIHTEKNNVAISNTQGILRP